MDKITMDEVTDNEIYTFILGTYYGRHHGPLAKILPDVIKRLRERYDVVRKDTK